MAELNLYKGLKSEYENKKTQIADGGLVVVKDENSSQTGNLYINDNGIHVKLSDDKAITDFSYDANMGEVVITHADGGIEIPLNVENGLYTESNNPVKTKVVASAINNLETEVNNKLDTKALLGSDGFLYSKRDFEQGTLILTNIDYSVDGG